MTLCVRTISLKGILNSAMFVALVLGFLAVPAHAQESTPLEPVVLEVTAPQLHLRTEPSGASDSKGILSRGQLVCGLRSLGGWTRVLVIGLEADRTGWASTRFLSEPSGPLAPAVAQRVCPIGVIRDWDGV
jgi:hypothetical protein